MIKYYVRKIRQYYNKEMFYRYILHFVDYSPASGPICKVLVDAEYNKEVLFDSVLSATLYANLDETLPIHEYVIWHPRAISEDLCVR